MNRTNQSPSLIQSQRGLTLIEIMVALVLSLFLIAGVIQLFLGSKQTYRFHDALSRLQENGRFALDSMTRDIRMAGFCIPPNCSSLPPPPGPINGTDNSINLAWVLPQPPPPPPLVVDTRNYDIALSTSASACPTAGNSLRLNSNGGGQQELIEGVESMQILYGVCSKADTDGDGVNDTSVVNPPYVNAATVGGNWVNVCSVRIHLLLVSLENNVVSEPQTIFFPADTNTQWPVNDRCLRQAFSTTVRIRNR